MPMGVKERKERERRQRKSEILETAKSLFLKNGFLNVTMNEIAAATELSTGTIYLYFKNKEDIFAALAVIGSEKLDEIVDKVLSKKNPLDKKNITHFIHAYLAVYNDYGCYFDLLLLNYRGKGHVNLSDGYTKAIREKTESSLLKCIQYFSSTVGEKAVDFERAKRLTLAFWTSLLGMSQLVNLGQKNLLPPELVDETIETAAGLLHDAFVPRM
jgi:AcrR family transcriptional regulator